MSSKKIICSSCGAEYDSRETKCPWCGTRHAAGAEREYMEKLSDVKEELEDLSRLPEQNFRRNAKQQFRQIRRVLLFAAVLFLIPLFMLLAAEYREAAEAKKELAWEKQNYPELNRLYQEKQYDELTDLVEEALEQERPVWNWRHYSFAMALMTLRDAEQCRDLLEQTAQEKDPEGLSSGEQRELLELLLFYELRLDKLQEVRDLTEEDLAYLVPRAAPWTEDRKQRFPMTEEELQGFYEEDWYVDIEKCREYVSKQNTSGS